MKGKDMQTLDEYEIQLRLSSVLSMIEQHGKAFLICRNGEPLADLTPHVKTKKTRGNKKSQISSEDFPVLQKLRKLIQVGLIVPHSKRIRKASMPKIEVQGKPMSEVIIEDRNPRNKFQG